MDCKFSKKLKHIELSKKYNEKDELDKIQLGDLFNFLCEKVYVLYDPSGYNSS